MEILASELCFFSRLKPLTSGDHDEARCDAMDLDQSCVASNPLSNHTTASCKTN